MSSELASHVWFACAGSPPDDLARAQEGLWAGSIKSAGLGFLAGAVGGAIGTTVLVAFQTGTLKGTEWMEGRAGIGHQNSREQKGLTFTGASEIVLPAIGFVPASQDRTATQHVGGLAGNVVYGVVTEGVRRLLR